MSFVAQGLELEPGEELLEVIKGEALRAMPGVEVKSPAQEDLSSGMVSFAMQGVDSLALQRHLARVAAVRTRVISEYDYGWMRLAPLRGQALSRFPKGI